MLWFHFGCIRDAYCIQKVNMATLTIKNLPDEIYAALTRKAKLNRRSINNEAIHRLESTLIEGSTDSEAELEEIKKLRRKTAGLWLTDEILERAKNEGRP